MPDRCQQFEMHLDAFIAGSLQPAVHQRLEAHARECGRCAALLSTVQGTSTDARESADVVEQVLASTSGRACQQSQLLLCDFVDGLLAGTDAQLLNDHLQHCPSCTSLSQALVLLRTDLLSLAECEPDADFVHDVIAATSAAQEASPSWIERLAATWNSLLQRPRFAWEAAWVGTAILLVLFGSPRSPLHDVPQTALALAQTNPVAAWNAAQPEMERAWGWVRDDMQAGWDASGGKVIEAVESRRGLWVQGHPQARESWQAMQNRLPTLRQAMVDGNLAQASYILSELGDDVQNMWHGMRAAPSDSLGSSTPPDREEN